jgi:hypothetical protein
VSHRRLGAAFDQCKLRERDQQALTALVFC